MHSCSNSIQCKKKKGMTAGNMCIKVENTPITWVGPGGGDQMLAGRKEFDSTVPSITFLIFYIQDPLSHTLIEPF